MSAKSFLVIIVLSLTCSAYVGLTALSHAKERMQLRHQQLERTLAAINE